MKWVVFSTKGFSVLNKHSSIPGTQLISNPEIKPYLEFATSIWIMYLFPSCKPMG